MDTLLATSSESLVKVPSEISAHQTVHVFASDFLPFPDCPRTAGGNRSLQIINALRKAGHSVTYSMPLVSDMAQRNLAKLGRPFNEEEAWLHENFFNPDIVLNRVQPDLAIYCNVNCFKTVRRFAKDIVHVLDLYGPVQFEELMIEAVDPKEAIQSGSGLEVRCRELVEHIRQVDYLITVSERQKYFWSAYCTLAGFSFEEINVLVCPASFPIDAPPRNPAPNLTVVYSGGFYPWQNPDRALRATARILDEIDGAQLHIFGGPHPGLPNEQHVNQLLSDLQQHRCVRYHGYRPAEELLAALSTAWCAVELMEQSLERELAITGRTLEFLATGTPVIYNNYATLSKEIERYNAGWTLSPQDPSQLHKVFTDLRNGGPALVEELSRNAKRLAATEFDEDISARALVDLCKGRLKKRRSIARTSAKAALGRVLAISPESNALLELRVNNPLRALHRQGAIESMTVVDPSLNELKHDLSVYSVVILQRTLPRALYQALANLSVDFLQDVDDNTLARAAYRAGVSSDVDLLYGLRECKVLGAPNPRLVRMLEKYSGLALDSKSYVIPNSLPFTSSARLRTPSRPTQIVWIQSDIAALGSNLESIVRAVDDFSVKYDLPIVLIGQNVFNQPRFQKQVILGQIDFTANLQMLEFGPPSIGIAPLETQSDQETLDFIAGKSDLKILLFGGYGHPAVYSASPPYTDSDLRMGRSVVENNYGAWLSALEYQFMEGWQTITADTQKIQSSRNSDEVARESWLPALRACELARPIRGCDLYEALQGSRQMMNHAASSVAYLIGNHDVAMNYPLSAWDHYVNYGHVEGRSLTHDPQSQANDLLRVEEESVQIIQDTLSKLTSLQEISAGLRNANHELRQQSAEMQNSMKNLQENVDRLQKELDTMRQSLSWKVTGPLRSLTQQLPQE